MFLPKTLIALGSAALLIGCASPAQHAARDLQQRLQANLSPELANRQATIETLPDGARVTLAEATLFSANRADLSTQGGYTIASVTESLLDPRLMWVQVTDQAAIQDDLRGARERSVQGYMAASQLGPSLPVEAQPMAAASTAPSSQGMVVTIHVQCPPGPQGSTWGYPNRTATCN